MRPPERKIRTKPSIAFASEAKARENIQVKLHSLLESLTTHKKSNPVEQSALLNGLPTSPRAFNAWANDLLDANEATTEIFRSNSRIALHRSGLLDSVEDALASVRAAKSAVISSGKRVETVARLGRALKVESQLRKIGEEEIVRLKRRIEELIDSADELKMQLNAANREASRLSAGVRSSRAKGSVVKLSSVARKTEGGKK